MTLLCCPFAQCFACRWSRTRRRSSSPAAPSASRWPASCAASSGAPACSAPTWSAPPTPSPAAGATPVRASMPRPPLANFIALHFYRLHCSTAPARSHVSALIAVCSGQQHCLSILRMYGCARPAHRPGMNICRRRRHPAHHPADLRQPAEAPPQLRRVAVSVAPVQLLFSCKPRLSCV